MVDILSSDAPLLACVHAASCLRSLAHNEIWAQEVRLTLFLALNTAVLPSFFSLLPNAYLRGREFLRQALGL